MQSLAEYGSTDESSIGGEYTRQRNTTSERIRIRRRGRTRRRRRSRLRASQTLSKSSAPLTTQHQTHSTSKRIENEKTSIIEWLIVWHGKRELRKQASLSAVVMRHAFLAVLIRCSRRCRRAYVLLLEAKTPQKPVGHPQRRNCWLK